MRSLAILRLVAPLAFAAPVPKELKKNDLSRFEGIWWEARCNDTVNADIATARRWSFGKDGTAGIHSRAAPVPSDYTFTIDQTTTPRTFTFDTKPPRGGGGNYVAIYDLQGDFLRFVLTEVKKPLPKEVKSGVGDVYYELKRVK